MASLIADNFFADPRLTEAKRLMLTALADHQKQLSAVKPADPARKQSYAETINHFNDLRAGALYFPYLGSGIGRGPLVELADGSVKYDLVSGIGVHHFGHSHPGMVEAALDAAMRDTIMQGNLQQDGASVKLSQLLVEAASKSGAKIKHAFLTTSGAMANENALKLIFQKKAPASRVLAFRGAFCGRTLALSQITDTPKYREGMPTTLNVDYVPFFDAANAKASTDAAIAALRGHLARYPGQHAAMMMELIQGEGGSYVGDRDFFLAIIKLLKEVNVAVFFDEVQTFGRTTRLFAFQHFGLDAFVDVVSIGKMSQACATLFTDEYKPRAGLISQTFTDSTSSIYASLFVVDSLLKSDCYGDNGRNAQVNRRFAGHFEAIAKRNPALLAGPFGIGGMIAFTPLDGSADAAKKAVFAMYDDGVIAFVAGHDPTRIRMLPPVPVITDGDIDTVCAMIERSLARAAK